MQVVVCKQTTHYLIMLSLLIVKGYSGITILIELKITVEYHYRKLLQAKQKSDFFPAVPKFIVANCMVRLLFFAPFMSIYFLLLNLTTDIFYIKNITPSKS